jgi:transketolase
MTDSTMANAATQIQMANAIRALSMDAVQKANSGHPGLPMGAADIATVLFTRFLKFDPKAPHWPDRDRFVLSAGHGSMLIYALLHLTGYADMTMEEIRNFRQWGAKTAGHPEFGHATGIETTTGPLGQGIANAVGMAIAERHLNAVFGTDLVEHKTYALVGDGCLMEGISQEAIAMAGHLKLKNLIVLWDDNGISIDGKVAMSDSTDQAKRFEASGWMTLACDGHKPDDIAACLQKAQTADRPVMIACKTIIGYGAPNKQGGAGVHGSPLGPDEIKAAREKLGWSAAPFEVPAPILKLWRDAGSRGTKDRAAWEGRLTAATPAIQSEFNRRQSGELPTAFHEGLRAYKQELAANPPAIASRNASQNALEVINPLLPDTLGGSADLTGSNNTKTKTTNGFSASDYSGRYMYYGIREHGMAAAMNGMALHGGVIPYGGTFLVFTDYCRPAIRLSALMQQRVVYVMTHDSIGLGEDGPTHQPVEHVASLRTIPNLLVMRPCDAMETTECWEIALASRTQPSILALTRQKLKPMRTEFTSTNMCALGAYELAATKKSAVVIFASGSEVEIAMQAKEILDAQGLGARVVSVPSMELFEQQSEDYKRKLLGKEKVRMAIEAGVRQSWDRFIGADGLFIGMTGFGASAPAEVLYEKFGITAKHAVTAVKTRLGAR